MRTAIQSSHLNHWMPLQRLGVRRLTRAHLSLDRRPQLGEPAREVMARIAAALSEQLACEVTLSGSRVESIARPAEELGALSAFATLELAAAGAKAILEVQLPDVVALVERLCGARPTVGPVLELTRLEEGAFGFLTLLAISALRTVDPFDRQWSPRLISVQSDRALVAREAGSAAHVAFELVLDVAGRPVRARAYVPADAIQTALETVALPSPRPLTGPVGQAELPLRCRTGRCELDLATLEGLSEGDVVLFAGPRFEEGAVVGPATLVSRTFQLEGSFNAQGFSLRSGACRPSPQAISHDGTRRPVPQEPSMSVDAASQLPVEIEVELTRVSVAISELSALEPGSVLPLQMSVSKPVLLRVGDRVVAKAELVDIEGEVGARILALCP